MQSYNEVKLQSSVDYITATYKQKNEFEPVEDVLFELVEEHSQNGGKVVPWAWKGYKGLSLGHTVWGKREDGWIVRSSGAMAQGLWMELGPTADNVTRLDLAVTVWYNPEQLGLARYAFQGMQERKRNGHSVSKFTLLQNEAGGSTFYLGSRKSSQMGRLYDKGVEGNSADAGRNWRYEVEFKKPRSGKVLESLLNSHHPEQDIAGAVWTWFYTRGLTPYFRADDNRIAMEVAAKIRTSESSLQWLSTQVRPTVQRLQKAGLHSDLYKALGLDIDAVVVIHSQKGE